MPTKIPPNRQTGPSFPDILSRRATEVQSKPSGMEALQMRDPEEIASYMDPVMGMLGSVTNITGQNLPEILLKGVKTQQQRAPVAANLFENILGKHSKPRELAGDLMKISPTKISNFNKKLSRWNMKLRSTTEKRTISTSKGDMDTSVLQIITKDPNIIHKRFKIGTPKSWEGHELVLATIEKSPKGKYWINDAFGYAELKNYLSAKVLESGRTAGMHVNLKADTLEELLDKLTKNLM